MLSLRHPADRRQGRLGGALPRGRPHRALRAHERRPDRRGEAPRRMAVTEGWAMLMHLVTEPAWLNRRLDVPGRPTSPTMRRLAPTATARSSCTSSSSSRQMTCRPCAAATTSSRRDALKLPVNPESTSTTSTAASTCIGYLRSWAFEAQLREFLRGEFGNEWFARRDAGDLLRKLWSLGQGPTADEVLSRTSRARSSRWLPSQIVREGRARRSHPRRPADRLDGARCRKQRPRRSRPLCVAYAVALRICAIRHSPRTPCRTRSWRPTAAAFDPARGNASTWLLTRCTAAQSASCAARSGAAPTSSTSRRPWRPADAPTRPPRRA